MHFFLFAAELAKEEEVVLSGLGYAGPAGAAILESLLPHLDGSSEKFVIFFASENRWLLFIFSSSLLQ